MKKEYVVPQLSVIVFHTDSFASDDLLDGSAGTGENIFPDDEE